MKTILKNLLKAIGIICYFLILLYATTRIERGRLVEDIKVFSGAFLILGIAMLEKAYKKDNGKTAMTGIELMIISFHSLSIMHIVNLLKYDLKIYLLISALVISAYYILKGIIIYTKERKEVLNNLSDISDIVKKDEPIKKEAKKREKKQEKTEENIDKEKKEKQINKTKKNNTSKSKKTKEIVNNKQEGKKKKTTKTKNKKTVKNQQNKKEVK